MRLGFFLNLEEIKLKLKVLQQPPLLARYAESSMFHTPEHLLAVREERFDSASTWVTR